MASDRKQFERATARWELLHTDNAYSVPSEIGRSAILCSYYNAFDYGQESSGKTRKDAKIFRKEALTLADRITGSGYTAEVILNAKADDIESVLQNPEISDVITIGNGGLSSFWVDGSSKNKMYDWRDVSKAADHLKTGVFVQRHCGLYDHELSVPIGTFAMADHSSVIAPVGHIFSPRGLDHPDNELLQHVTELPQLTYNYVKNHFS